LITAITVSVMLTVTSSWMYGDGDHWVCNSADKLNYCKTN